METRLRIGTNVRVSAELTGDGNAPKGVITNIEQFAGQTYYGVMFLDQPGGTTTTNPGMLTII